MGEVHGTLLKRMRLEVSIPGQLTMTALNEVNIYRGASPSLTRLECSIGNELLTHAIADGYFQLIFFLIYYLCSLLLSTPTGSTAYSLSAGGPIMHPSVMGMLLTPICPRSLSFRPVILPTQTTIRVRVSEESRACAQMSIDGQAPVELPRGSQVIIKESPFPLPVLSPIDATQEWIHSINGLLDFNRNFNERHF